jgi:Fe-S cluster biogenesis protein NfuA
MAIIRQRPPMIWLVLGLSFLLAKSAQGFSASTPFLARNCIQNQKATRLAAEPDSSTPTAPAPTLNGKRVLPFKVLAGGLKGSKIAAVYAVLNSTFKRGSEGWEAAEFIGVTQDLDASLQAHFEQHGSEKVAHIRGLSFSFPQPNAMQDVAQQWRDQARTAGAVLQESGWANNAMDYLFDEDDDDDDDDDEGDWSAAMSGMGSQQGIVSPVEDSASAEEPIVSPFEEAKSEDPLPTAEGGVLAFTPENVDKVLDEVRPYLISDGGNVSVERVVASEMNVYLKLEGACGSCASSTVTMKMGIERVLRENFPDLNEVLQVEDDDDKPTELTYQAVEDEVNRLKTAIVAMGGFVGMYIVVSYLINHTRLNERTNTTIVFIRRDSRRRPGPRRGIA